MILSARNRRDLRVATQLAKLFIRRESFAATTSRKASRFHIFTAKEERCRSAVDRTRIAVPLSKIFASRRPGNSVLRCTMEHVKRAKVRIYSGLTTIDLKEPERDSVDR